MRSTALLIFLSMLTACSNDAGNTGIQMDLLSENAEAVIREMTAGVPATELDLDSVEPDTLAPDLMIGSSDPDSEDAVLLSRSASLTLFGDSLYALDSETDMLLIAHRDSARFSRYFGTKGEGPGEFRQINDAFVSNEYLFVKDFWARGLHAFDKRMSYFDFIPGPGMSRTDAGGSTLATSRDRTSQMLLTIRDGSPAFAERDSLFPRLTGPEDPAELYNTALVGINTAGAIAAAWPAIPLVFVHNPDLAIEHVIRFRADVFGGLDEAESGGFGRLRIRHILNSLDYSDAGRVLFLYRGDLIVAGSGQGGSYRARRFIMTDGSGDGEQFRPTNFAMSGDSLLYASSLFDSRVFRYRLHKLLE